MKSACLALLLAGLLAGCRQDPRQRLPELDDPALAVRLRAARALAPHVADGAVAAAFGRRLQVESEPAAVQELVEALCRSSGAEARAALLEALPLLPAAGRLAAVRSLGRTTPQAGATRLAALYRQDRSPVLREEILRALGGWGRLDLLGLFTEGDDDGDGRANEDPPDRLQRNDDGDELVDEDGRFADNGPGAPELELRLETDRQAYAPGDSLFLNLQLINRAAEPRRVALAGEGSGDWSGLMLFVQNRSGQSGEIESPVAAAGSGERPLADLASGEGRALPRQDLSEWYFTPVPGTYTLVAVYYTGVSIDERECGARGCLAEFLVSNRAVFTIREEE